MAAPEFVPVDQMRPARWYSSPDQVPSRWRADRVGDLNAPQPSGTLMGSQGPDQGYGIKLANTFKGKLTLTRGETEADALAGCLGVALKRASMFGRAPVIYDFTVAFTMWGFLRNDAPKELVKLRTGLFANAALVHHYAARRAIADAVPESTLRLVPAELLATHSTDWRSLIAA